jgi:hypothetical protein
MGLNLFSSYTRELQAQQVAEAQVRARKQDAADDVVIKQLSDIRKTLPVELPPELAAALPPASLPVPTRRTPTRTNYVPYAVGGIAALAVLAMLARGNR